MNLVLLVALLGDCLRDRCGRLHNSPEGPAPRGSKFGQSAGQAANPQWAVLRTIIAIEARGVVTRGKLRAPLRRRRIVRSPVTAHPLDLASLGRLHQGEAKF